MKRDADLGTMKPEGRDLDSVKKSLRQDLNVDQENLTARRNFMSLQLHYLMTLFRW